MPQSVKLHFLVIGTKTDLDQSFGCFPVPSICWHSFIIASTTASESLISSMGMLSLPGALLFGKSLIAAMNSFYRMSGSWSDHRSVLYTQVILVEFLSVFFPLVSDFFPGSVNFVPLVFFSMPILGRNFSLDLLNFHIGFSGPAFQVFLFHFYAHPLVVSFFVFPYSALMFPADHICCLPITTGFGCSPFLHSSTYRQLSMVVRVFSAF